MFEKLGTGSSTPLVVVVVVSGGTSPGPPSFGATVRVVVESVSRRKGSLSEVPVPSGAMGVVSVVLDFVSVFVVVGSVRGRVVVVASVLV